MMFWDECVAKQRHCDGMLIVCSPDRAIESCHRAFAIILGIRPCAGRAPEQIVDGLAICIDNKHPVSGNY
jgi:hypothetical protein